MAEKLDNEIELILKSALRSNKLHMHNEQENNIANLISMLGKKYELNKSSETAMFNLSDEQRDNQRAISKRYRFDKRQRESDSASPNDLYMKLIRDYLHENKRYRFD